MQSKYFKNVVSKFIVLTFVGSLAPSLSLASNDNDALYESRAELESAQVNLEDAQVGYDSSAEELQVAKDNHGAVTGKNIESAARIRQEIERLQKEQSDNLKLAKKLSEEAQSSAKQAVKNEAAEKKAQSSAGIAATKLEKVRASFDKSQARKSQSAQALSDVKIKLARTEQELKAKTKELTVAKTAEQRSAVSLKNAQVQFKKYQAKSVQEMKRLNKQLQLSLAKTALNDKKAESLRQKKQQLEATLKEKRQRLSESKSTGRKSLARVSSN